MIEHDEDFAVITKYGILMKSQPKKSQRVKYNNEKSKFVQLET